MWCVLKRNAVKVYNANIRRISSYIDISEEIKHALQNNLPTVALESTIITHGMPYPNNMECAKEVENIVRERGAIPATIAILDGRIKVGLSATQLTELADTEKRKAIKTSRRDFGYVLANKLNGGTTVAGTLIVAKDVGIEVFGTGGLGGVHREAAQTFDISADLIELGNSPVAVISSGVKSILDIPKTLEYLETQGVFVATFGENKAFPAFYCRFSDCDAPYNVSSAIEAANIIISHLKLGLKSGLLFAVPVPEKYGMNSKEMNEVIEQALLSAKDKGISGKEITPYLLTEINKITNGSSLQTNIALIKNNARVAADIAVELTKLKSNSYGNIQGSGKVNVDVGNKPVVIGGSIIDCCATLKGNDLSFNGTIFEAKFKQHAGGVGRNIAEALSKLGCEPTFISVVGNDSYGHNICSLLPEKCTKHIYKSSNHNTAQCNVIFDKRGECKILIGDMDIHQQITPDIINKHETEIRKCPLLILDGNLSVNALEAALKLADKHDTPVFFEPTDVPICSKPFETKYWRSIKYITPNLVELKHIAETLKISFPESSANIVEDAVRAGKAMVEYIPNIIITLGPQGVVVVRKASSSSVLFNYKSTSTDNIEARHYPVDNIQDFVNVSGAGDCLASGIITAMLSGLNEGQCINVGFAAAVTAMFSDSAVPKLLFDKNHTSWYSSAKYKQF